MRYFLFTILVACVPLVAVFGQENDNPEPAQAICFQPFSYKFAELVGANEAGLGKKLSEFQQKLSEEAPESTGLAIIYGGRNASVSELPESGSKIRRMLGIKEPQPFRFKFVVIEGGYRAQPTVELFIQPLACSERPVPRPDLAVEDVNFAEAPLDRRIKKNPAELERSLVSSPRAQCPAAATAVGACGPGFVAEVFVIIDETGKPIVAKAVSGHPLLRYAAQRAVLRWRFSPATIAGVMHSVDGRVTVEFQPSNMTIDY